MSALDDMNQSLDLWAALRTEDELRAILSQASHRDPATALAWMSAVAGHEIIINVMVSYLAGVLEMKRMAKSAATTAEQS